jgi:hypothetical protein
MSKRKFEKAKRAAAQESLESLEAIMREQVAQQEKMAREFDVHACNEVTVNIWGDYKDGGTTPVNVESSEMPETVVKEVLLHILSYVSKPLSSVGVDAQIDYHNPFHAHPDLVSKPSAWCVMRPHWHLSLSGMRPELEDKVVEIFKAVPSYQ